MADEPTVEVTQADVTFANHIIAGFRTTSAGHGGWYKNATIDHWLAKDIARHRATAMPGRVDAEAMREAAVKVTRDSAALWRRGIRCAVQALDRTIVADWSASRRRQWRDAASILSMVLGVLHDAPHAFSPGNWKEASDLDDEIANALAPLIGANAAIRAMPLPPAPGASAYRWLPIESAPKDGTMLRLLVDYTDGAHALADEYPLSLTIGFNGFDDDGVDEWKFAGWCWTHDHFVQGRGKPVGWLPWSNPAPGLGASAEEAWVSTSDPTEAEVDRAAQHLRETQQGGKSLTPWDRTPKATKRKWVELAWGTLRAARSALTAAEAESKPAAMDGEG